MKIEARPYFTYEWRGRYPNGMRRFFGDRKFGFTHSLPGGVPVLRGQSSWRTINGVFGNVFGGFFILEFRRFQL